MRISDWSSDVCSSDLVLLRLISILICIGMVAVAAASPVASQKLSTNQVELDPLYYFYRQLLWVGVGVPIMLVISMLPRVQARRFSIFLTVLLTVLLMLVPIIGTTVNGATRWLGSDAFRFQPSEFLKPVFVVTLAWMLSLRSKDRTLPEMEEHTSELQSLMRISYAVFCLKKKKNKSSHTESYTTITQSIEKRTITTT